eukprot:1903313-Rhodomonas_salina.1
MSGTDLRTPYAMSGTDLRTPYTMSGTDLRTPHAMPGTDLHTSDAMSGTDLRTSYASPLVLRGFQYWDRLGRYRTTHYALGATPKSNIRKRIPICTAVVFSCIRFRSVRVLTWAGQACLPPVSSPTV